MARNQRQEILHVFNKFLAHQRIVENGWPETMDDVSEVQANEVSFYEHYAHWLSFKAEASRGTKYALGTRIHLLRGIAQILAQTLSKPGNLLSKLDQQNNWMSSVVVRLKQSNSGPLAFAERVIAGHSIGHTAMDYILAANESSAPMAYSDLGHSDCAGR